jgi:putative lipoic acid-binding regulatory protein
MSPQLGLDKLQFLLPISDVTISPDFPATVENPVNAATGEALAQRVLYRAGDREVCGRVAHYNTKNYQLAVKHSRTGDYPSVIVQFSAGAFADSNLEPLDGDACMDVAQAVQKDLAEKGVLLDLSAARLLRLDIAQNVQLAHPVACYAPALAALGARKRTRKMDFGGTGFIVGNKSWEIGFYDKGEQMKTLGYAADMRPTNTVRPEVRLMKARLIKGSFTAETLPELRKSWREMKPVYNRFLRRDVFRAALETRKQNSLNLDELASVVRENVERNIFQRFMTDLAHMALVDELGEEGAKIFAATQFGFSRDTKSGCRQIERINANLASAAFALKMQARDTSGRKVAELQRELKQACLGGDDEV